MRPARNGIQSASAEGVTADNPAETQPAAAKQAPLANGLNAILAAGRVKFTTADQQRGQHHLVATDEQLGGQDRQPTSNAED